MAYTAVTCPQCGAAITSVPDRGSFFCQYCGARIEKEQLNINISGNVTVAGMASVESLLERGYIFLEDEDYAQADRYFERVLDADPKCAKAYIGKLLVQNKKPDIKEFLRTYNYQVERHELYKKALHYAKSDEYDEIVAIKSENVRIHEQYMQNIQININQATKQLNDFNQYFAANHFSNSKYWSVMAIAIILLVVAIFGFLFGVIGLFAAGPVGLICVIPFGGALAGLSIWCRKIRKQRAEGEKLEQEQQRLQAILDSSYRAQRLSEEYWNGYDR